MLASPATLSGEPKLFLVMICELIRQITVNSITSRMPMMNVFSCQALSLYQTIRLVWMAKSTGMSEQPIARSLTPLVKMVNDLTGANDIFALVSRGTDSSSG